MTLALEALTAGYRGAPTLLAITARLEGGTVAALVGPNGSGKSTLLRAVAGLLPAGGRLLLDGAILDVPVRRLDQVSGGQRQLAHLAQALVRRPPVLLLDEPTAALDLRHQLIVLDAVRAHARETGAVVVVAIHDLTLAAQIPDAMLCLSAGRLEAAGAPAAVLAPALIARVWGVEAEVEPSGTRGVRVRQVRPVRPL